MKKHAVIHNFLYNFNEGNNSFFIKFKELIFGLFIGAYENADYGNLQILNEYLGRKINKPISTRISHGWAWKSPGKTPYKNNFLNTLVWGEESKNYALEKGWRNFKDIGAIWLYFLHNMNRNGWAEIDFNPTIGELWVLGKHSNTSKMASGNDISDFLKRAESSKTCNKAVLLSFHDYNFAKSKNLLSSISVPVLTLGPRRLTNLANSHYMQLYFLLKNTKHIITNYPTTLLLYGHTVGCNFSFTKDKYFYEAIKDAKDVSDDRLESFLNCNFSSKDELENYVNEMLGMKSFRSESELNIILKRQVERSWTLRGAYAIGNLAANIFRAVLKKYIKRT